MIRVPFHLPLPRAAAACNDAASAFPGPARAPVRFRASAFRASAFRVFAGAETDEMPGPVGPALTEPGSGRARLRQRRRDCARRYVAVGAEAVVLALLIVVVGRQLMPVAGAAASGGAGVSWAHGLLVEARQLLARGADTGAWTWLMSVLASLLTVAGPWLRRPAVRWGLAAAVGSRPASVIAWIVVAALAGFSGQL
ncbi:hypothetical protein E4J66_07565 [Actinomyces viscosus]|nr:hypothetical protein [Actinomyces viscosus]TFH52487.1 hypothetical protein E4J66_07565 [Actinomyces viscosus]